MSTEPKERGRYGVLDASAYVPQRNTSGYEVTQAIFSALDQIKAALFSAQARLHTTETVNVAVWFGGSLGWTWLSGVPFPSPVSAIEWRTGCSRCGSIVHASCPQAVGSFNPDPPFPKETQSAVPYAPRGGQQSFAPEREYVSPEEKAELDAIAREYPDGVKLARPGVSSSIEACRAVRDQLRKAKETGHAAS